MSPISKSTSVLSALHSFSKKYLNPQVKINKTKNKHTVSYHPSPSKLTLRIHPLIFPWTPKRSANHHGCGKKTPQWGVARGHGPQLFLKSYFARDVFLEICFCVILQGIQNWFGTNITRILSGALEKFQFMVLRLLEETFLRQKIDFF